MEELEPLAAVAVEEAEVELETLLHERSKRGVVLPEEIPKLGLG